MGKLADADLEFRPIAKTPQTRPTAELGELLAVRQTVLLFLAACEVGEC